MAFDVIELRVKELPAGRRSCCAIATRDRVARSLATALALAAAASMPAAPARAQGAALSPTSPVVDCPSPGQDLVMPPEIVSLGGTLRGAVVLSEENQRLPTATGGGTPTCAPQWVRVFRGKDSAGADLPAAPAANPADADHPDPIPGPTLRAQVGDLIQLTFINQVYSNRFDKSLDIEACTRVGENGKRYPSDFDTYPNCLHASSTANIHFHGTHTTPNSTGDNVYLQVRPLPRNNQGALRITPEVASVGFDDFFKACAKQLQKNLVQSWPTTWSDVPELKPWTDVQTELLKDHQAKNPTQRLWTEDEHVLAAGGWPQYYIGAVPFCFGLPPYTAQGWPPPPDSASPIMGQAPGTHWYHAHKHGSTAINVANGMTGAFIIEGDYDKYMDENYGAYDLKNGKWTARSQPVLVLNQLGTTPNLLTSRPSGAGTAGVDFAVNGRLRPTAHMQPGEIQLWRIVNTSGRNALYFMPPAGFDWRQLAQDGVQLANDNYQDSRNKPFYMAPGNRVDLLVKAPNAPATLNVLVQAVMARNEVVPDPLTAAEPKPGVILMTVDVSGDPVMLNGNAAQMDFLTSADDQPPFLTDITDEELRLNNDSKKTLEFNSGSPKSPAQHTINGIQFANGHAEVGVVLGAVEEWTVKNFTVDPGMIDHPFHIHINPFQVTEVFDPNEKLVDPTTGKLETVLVNNATQTVFRYVTDKAELTNPNNPFAKRQCYLDTADKATWSVAGACGPQAPQSKLVWWDVFAIPSARQEGPVVIPGYFKMRSRFVDYPGLYVLHCHILVHEDRGMMFSVEVVAPRPVLLQHH